MTASDPDLRAAGMFAVGFPELWDGGGTRPERRFVARLRVKDESAFVTIGRARNAYHAALGYFGLLQHVASEEASGMRGSVAAGLTTLVDSLTDDLNPPDFDETTALYGLVSDAVREPSTDQGHESQP
jgi:hypothetical protein